MITLNMEVAVELLKAFIIDKYIERKYIYIYIYLNIYIY